MIYYHWSSTLLFFMCCKAVSLGNCNAHVYSVYVFFINPKPCGYINLCWCADRLLRRPIGEREALHHALAVVGSSRSTLRKSYRPCRRLQNCLVRRLLAGGVPGLGGGGRGGLRSQISLPSRPKYMKTAKKGGFAHVLAYKSMKTLFFAQKYWTR
jgi:hypothetical protein